MSGNPQLAQAAILLARLAGWKLVVWNAPDDPEADARKVDFGRETKNRSFVMSHDKIEPMIWERF